MRSSRSEALAPAAAPESLTFPWQSRWPEDGILLSLGWLSAANEHHGENQEGDCLRVLLTCSRLRPKNFCLATWQSSRITWHGWCHDLPLQRTMLGTFLMETGDSASKRDSISTFTYSARHRLALPCQNRPPSAVARLSTAAVSKRKTSAEELWCYSFFSLRGSHLVSLAMWV